jgi:hypothetical protein
MGIGYSSQTPIHVENLDKELILNDLKKYIDEKETIIHQKCLEEQERQRKAYDELHKKYSQLLESSSQVEIVKSKISDEAIDKFILTLLKDPKTNISWVPDSIEGAMYSRMLKTLLHSLGHAVDSAEVKLLGHKFRVIAEPCDE